MRCHAALLAAVFVGSAWGLRSEAAPSEPLRAGGQAAKLPPTDVYANAQREPLRAGGQVAHLPSLEVFESLWMGDHQKEPSGVPFLREVQLVLGVFATEADDPRIREVIRRFWMDQPGVCMLTGSQTPHCSVYTGFVLGSKKGQGYSDDELVLNVPENMNGGKTLDFFGRAAESFPWATHIAKMDLDTFPYLRRLTESLRQHVGSGCEHYFGEALGWQGCGCGAHCPPKECSTPVGGDFLKYDLEDSKNCWSYMQGGLYGMSASLARNLTAPGTWWHQHHVGHEDLTAGKAVGIYAREKNVCVSAWNPLAWDHIPKYGIQSQMELSCGSMDTVYLTRELKVERLAQLPRRPPFG